MIFRTVQNSNYIAFNAFGIYQVKKLRAYLVKFDANHDGILNKAEFRKMLMHMGQPLNARELRECMLGLDMDMDGKLDFDELLEGLLGVVL